MEMHGVIRTDRMFGTDNRSGLVSVRCDKNYDNGTVVKLGALEEGAREIYTAEAPAAGDKNLVVIASPEVMYDEHKHNIAEFYNKEGTIARAYRLHTGSAFGITKEAYEGEAVVGQGVEPQANNKWKIAAVGENSVGKIIAIEKVGRFTYAVVEVL